MEKMIVSGVARDNKCARVAVINLPDEPGFAFKVFSILAKNKINVDMILQSYGRGESKDIVFTLAEKDVPACTKLLEENKQSLGYENLDVSTDVSKVSIVGAGMLGNAGVAAKMFEALYQAHINIRMISTSEIKISVLIDKDESERAVKAIHSRFFQ